MSNLILKINLKDNVLVALQDIPAETEIIFEGDTYTTVEAIPAKHKFFMNDMKQGDQIFMYGVLVGKVQYDLAAGTRMTTDNTKHAAEPYYYRDVDYHWTKPDVSRFLHKTFKGYHRSNGDVGTANYWLFIPTVFCENRNLDIIKESLYDSLGYAVDAKYKDYTQQLVEAISKGENLDDLNFHPPIFRRKTEFLKM